MLSSSIPQGGIGRQEDDAYTGDDTSQEEQTEKKHGKSVRTLLADLVAEETNSFKTVFRSGDGHTYVRMLSKGRAETLEVKASGDFAQWLMRTAYDVAGMVPSENAVKTLLMLREPFVKLLRERFASTRDGEILASAAGALREKQEEQQTLAASVGLTTNAAVRQAIIAQMETVAEEVQKLEAAYQEAQQVEEREQAAETWIQSMLDKIYGWRTTWAQTVDAETEMFYTPAPQPDLDELPFDLKRVAVEASGIVVKLCPVGSEERIQVAFNQSISGTTIDSNDSALVEVATPGRSR